MVASVTCDLASAITKAASKQTYYTIRFLVDRPRVEDAYLAYAYFRWVDDVLDAVQAPGWAAAEVEREERARFLERQKALLAACLRGDEPVEVGRHEAMLVQLIRHAGPSDPRLGAYVRHMMRVMEFDVGRRGRLISGDELEDYTRSLAIAVTEAMHYFIGDGAAAPDDETRYMAVRGAHIVHMLRDTFVDARAGYFNVPREILEGFSIGPEDVRCDAYRAWVRDRVRLARTSFDAGKTYFAGLHSRRHRLAGLLYMARFEWLIDTLERNGFTLQAEYRERRHPATVVRTGRYLAATLARPRRVSHPTAPLSSPHGNRT
jgi:phytoene/squalene synthetase